MAEQTKGGGFRERIYFDEELWHDIEAVAAHMRLKPPELVKLLAAMGLAQMKGLTMMHTAATQNAMKQAIEQQMTEDFERNTGVSDAPVVGSAPASGRTPPARTASSQSTAMSAPGRNPVQKNELARVDGPPSYLRGL